MSAQKDLIVIFRAKKKGEGWNRRRKRSSQRHRGRKEEKEEKGEDGHIRFYRRLSSFARDVIIGLTKCLFLLVFSPNATANPACIRK